jgi:hypothetical protein
VTFYGDCVNICEDFAPKLFTAKELAVASQQRIASRFIFHQGLFDQKQLNRRPTPTLLFPVSRLKLKLKGRHFDRLEVIEALGGAEHPYRTRFPGCI